MCNHAHLATSGPLWRTLSSRTTSSASLQCLPRAFTARAAAVQAQADAVRKAELELQRRQEAGRRTKREAREALARIVAEAMQAWRELVQEWTRTRADVAELWAATTETARRVVETKHARRDAERRKRAEARPSKSVAETARTGRICHRRGWRRRIRPAADATR